MKYYFKSISNFVVMAFAFISVISCAQLEDFPIEPFSFKNLIKNRQTLLIAHRGGASNHNENTLEAAKLGFQNLDGVELDIQISKDNTLWLAHDAETPSCGAYQSNDFNELTDDQIQDLNNCLAKQNRLNSLEEVFAYMAINHPKAKVALDIKPKRASQLLQVAHQIDALSQKYKVSKNIFVESGDVDFLKNLKTKNNLIECHLLEYSNPEQAAVKALKNGLDGISYRYYSKADIDVKSIKKRGLSVQLWTINEATDLENALKLVPTTIQTDRLDL